MAHASVYCIQSVWISYRAQIEYFCFYVLTFAAAVVCPENQTAQLGGQGYITCNFPDGFRSIYWFDNTSDRSPVISFIVDSGAKSGQGFQTGDYDIHPNGSLIISNVTKWHEREYRGIVYPDLTFDVFLVSLKVIGKYDGTGLY